MFLTRTEIGWLIGLLLVWIPGILVLAEIWSEVEYASHGFLVPLVALWAATAHRVELAALTPRPIAAGLFGLALCVITYGVALLAENATAIGLALVATITCLVLAFRGRAWARTLRFSLLYLLFMVPLPVEWVTPLIVRLQLWVSSAAVWILQSSGVAIYREGNILTLPGDVTLFVAEACSGITSLITLIPIGVFIAYFTEVRFARRFALVLAVVPIALAGNLLRVLLTVIIATQYTVETATQGPLHDWAGVGTYVIGCLCLLGVGAAMRALWPDPETASSAGT